MTTIQLHDSTVAQRLETVGWDEVLHVPELGSCWEWKGYRNKARGGYGAIHFGIKTMSTHRVAYQLWVDVIPKGLHVLHRCDNPPCINPEHLFVGTNLDNMKDRDAKGRHVAGRLPGSSNKASKLTEQDVIDIRSELANGVSQAALGRKYGVAKQVIWGIKHGKRWRHV